MGVEKVGNRLFERFKENENLSICWDCNDKELFGLHSFKGRDKKILTLCGERVGLIDNNRIALTLVYELLMNFKKEGN